MPTGSLPPDGIHVPGIYVDRVVQGGGYERFIERLTLAGEETEGSGLTPERERIARRAASTPAEQRLLEPKSSSAARA